MANADGVFTRILVPTDFSEPSQRAWTTAQRLASAAGGELMLLHVVAEGALYSEGFMSSPGVRAVMASAREWAEKTLGEWAQAARASGVRVQTALRTGAAHIEIAAAARETKADLIAIGTRGRSGFDRVLVGSVTEKVLRIAPCTVLAVRTPE